MPSALGPEFDCSDAGIALQVSLGKEREETRQHRLGDDFAAKKLYVNSASNSLGILPAGPSTDVASDWYK